MKNLLTGTAQSVRDTNERVRTLFENCPMEAPSRRERHNRPRETLTKAAAEEKEVEADAVPEVEVADESVPEADTPRPMKLHLTRTKLRKSE